MNATMSRKITEHITNIQNFLALFFKSQGVYDIYQTWIHTTVIGLIKYVNMNYSQQTEISAINSMVEVACTHIDGTCEILEEWHSKENQSMLAKVIKRQGKHMAKPRIYKLPRNAYNFFCLDMRDNIKSDASNPQDIERLLGHRWNSIKNTKESQVYYQMALKDKELFDTKKGRYITN